MHNLTATVAAISTPPGKGGVSLIRVSGDAAFSICERVFFPKNGKRLSEIPPRTQVWGEIVREGETVDDGMAVRFVAPHSYTGENTVEITCHGGVLLTRCVLEALFAAGAEPAGRGEFTRRAFTNGKLSLTDAEGIGNLIDAVSMGQIRLSATRSRDKLSSAIRQVREDLTAVLSSILARVDYPEEDLGDFSDAETVTRLSEISADLSALLSTYRTGRSVAEGIRTAIVGKPNVGKSSLYNLLVGEDAAIVTEVAGTTRDVLERTASAGDLTLRLSDTAGMRNTDDPVEKIGVEKSRLEVEKADLVLALFDGSKPLDAEDFDLIDRLKKTDKTVIAVLNKTDLPAVLSDTDVGTYFPYVCPISAKTGNADRLLALIQMLFRDEKLTVGEDAIVYSARQYKALCEARDAVNRSIAAYRDGLFADAASSDAEIALATLSELDGVRATDEIVADIFRKFCVGK